MLLLFPLWRGPTPPQSPVLHSSFFILRNPVEVPTTCFAIFPLKISYRVFLRVPPLPRCDFCPELHHSMPFVVVLSFLRHGDHLSPRSFIRSLPRSYCLRPRPLMPLLHSGLFQRRFPNVRPFRVSCTTLCWPYLLLSCPLRRATFVLRIILLPAAANSLRSPQFPWVRIFLKTFLLLHATLARRDTFLQAAANFLRDPQSPRVSSFGSPRRPTASFRPLCRFFRPLTGFTMASSVGTSRCSTSDSMSLGFSFLLARHAATVTW
jgi:hypothetical protein